MRDRERGEGGERDGRVEREGRVRRIDRVERVDAVLRVAAALVGSLPVALFASLCLARFLPFAENVRVAVGFAAALPLWVTTMCAAFLARTGARAWALCAGLGVVLGALALGVPH